MQAVDLIPDQGVVCPLPGRQLVLGTHSHGCLRTFRVVLMLHDCRRHAGNMLVRRPRGSSSSGGGGGLARLAEARLELCPIDHGFCLPEGLEPPYFEWLHWPQVCSVGPV